MRSFALSAVFVGLLASQTLANTDYEEEENNFSTFDDLDEEKMLDSQSSVLNVNKPQHSVYEDDDGEMIEDYSVDTYLDAQDDEEEGFLQPVSGTRLPKRNILEEMLDIDESLGDDYVEELMDAEGHSMRKEVHKGKGWTSVSISGAPGNLGMADPLQGFLEELFNSPMFGMAPMVGMPQLSSTPQPMYSELLDTDPYPYFDDDDDDYYYDEDGYAFNDPYYDFDEMDQLMEQHDSNYEAAMGGFAPPIFDFIPMNFGAAPLMTEDQIKSPEVEKQVVEETKNAGMFMFLSLVLIAGVAGGIMMFMKDRDEIPAKEGYDQTHQIKLNNIQKKRNID